MSAFRYLGGYIIERFEDAGIVIGFGDTTFLLVPRENGIESNRRFSHGSYRVLPFRTTFYL